MTTMHDIKDGFLEYGLGRMVGVVHSLASKGAF